MIIMIIRIIINLMINAIMIIINIIIIINNIIIRQEAVDYMEANTALSRVAVEREVTKFLRSTFVFWDTLPS